MRDSCLRHNDKVIFLTSILFYWPCTIVPSLHARGTQVQSLLAPLVLHFRYQLSAFNGTCSLTMAQRSEPDPEIQDEIDLLILDYLLYDATKAVLTLAVNSDTSTTVESVKNQLHLVQGGFFIPKS